MERREKILSTKFYLKGLSNLIRELKKLYKQNQREGKITDNWKVFRELEKSKYEFRHQHITYCLAKKVNITHDENGYLTDEAIERYNKIESKVKDGNEPDWDYVKELSKAYPVIQEVRDEATVCDNAE